MKISIQEHTARTPKTFIRKEPAAFNFSGDFPLAANSLSAYKKLQTIMQQNISPKF